MSIYFSINVVLRNGEADDNNNIHHDDSCGNHDTEELEKSKPKTESALEEAYVCYGKFLRISQDKTECSRPRYAGIFVPSTLVDAALNQIMVGHRTTSDDNIPSNCFISIPSSHLHRLSRSLLSMVHPFLERNFCLHSVISIRNEQHAPSDLVLLDLSHAPLAAVADLMETTNCEMIHAGDYSVLKVILVSQVQFSSPIIMEEGSNALPTLPATAATTSPLTLPSSSTPSSFDLPTCPVCLHRVDPLRLGLPKPPNHQLCSKFCPLPEYNHLFLGDSTTTTSKKHSSWPSCPRQRLLRPWPPPSRCVCCQIIQNYWSSTTTAAHPSSIGTTSSSGSTAVAARVACNNHYQTEEELSQVFCYDCALQETLWVCMTCGYVGCGRYSNKHAASHFAESGHPYSLELATLRIWDYVGGEFVHRADLLQCPCCIVASATMAMSTAPPLPSSSSSSLSPFMMTTTTSSSIGYASAITTAATQASDSKSVLLNNNSETCASTGGILEGESGARQGGVLSCPFATTQQSHDNDHHDHDKVAVVDQAALLAQLAHHEHHNRSSNNSYVDEKTPKKATMIGEEYEALLQSALEEQAQHYEGLISRLLATLTAESVDASSITAEEQELIDTWQKEIHQMRLEMETVSRQLLDAQAQEAGYRATSSRLLREQQVAEDLLKKVQEETVREEQEGRRQVEELEQQIADLMANQRMRDQFSQDEELSNAQIFGTAASSAQKPRGKNKGGKLNKLLRRSRK